MIDSFNIGVAAEFYAASVLIELGYDVLLPFDRRGKYDLAAIAPDKSFLKFQVKRANWIKPHHTTSEYLRVSTASKGVAYTKEDIDYFLFVAPDKRVWKVPVEEVCNMRVVTLDKRASEVKSWSTDKRFKSEEYLLCK